MTHSTAPPNEEPRPESTGKAPPFDKYPEYTRNFADVYSAELGYLKERRKKMGIDNTAIEDTLCATNKVEAQKKGTVKKLVAGFLWIYRWFLGSANTPKTLDNHVQPSTERGLVGLALSGGGVRSATFNLGLLQSLAKNKVLRYCDYLSTVSGGGLYRFVPKFPIGQ